MSSFSTLKVTYPLVNRDEVYFMTVIYVFVHLVVRLCCESAIYITFSFLSVLPHICSATHIL